MKRYLDFKNEAENYGDVSVTIKTIEQIAASHIHDFKSLVYNLESYVSNITNVLSRLSLFYSDFNHPYLLRRNTGSKILIVVTSRKGLVGKLYHDIVSTIIDNKLEYDSIYTVGNKGKQYLEEEKITIEDKNFNISSDPDTSEIQDITNYFFSLYSSQPIMEIDVLYPEFISITEQTPKIFKLLPFDFDFKKLSSQKNEDIDQGIGLPLFESSKQELFRYMLEKYIQSIFYKIIIESKLSEFAARTVSMEHASAKIKTFKTKLELDYLKERRIVVTQKQLEIFTAHRLR